MTTELNENTPASALTYLVRGADCYLVNASDTDIAELEYDSSFVGFEDGGVISVEYGRWRLQSLPAGSYVAVYTMSQEDIMYLPMRSGWFQLDVHRAVTVDGVAINTPLLLKASEKWGGFAFQGAPLERNPERVDLAENKEDGASA